VADRLGDKSGVGGVDFAVHAQQDAWTAVVNGQLRARAVDHAAPMVAALRRHVGKSSHVITSSL
jgi:hypothetical protein